MSAIVIYTQPQTLQVKKYQGQPVLTLADIDALHKRPTGTASRNFKTNRERFIEGEDYFLLTPALKDEIRTLEIPNRGLTVLTKMGYLMLAKSFTDDLAWSVQRQLVKSYFEANTEQKESAMTPLPQIDRLIELLENQQRPKAALPVPPKPAPLVDISQRKLLCPEELAAYLSIGRNKALDLLHTNGFPTVRIGRRIFADRVKLDCWISSQSGQGV